MTAVGSKPLMAPEAERAFVGKMFEASVLDKVASLAVEASKPRTDVTASETYRCQVLGILVKDALEASYKRAGWERMRKVKTSFKVNGNPVELELEPRRLLVSVLRDDLGLTGIHQGCDTTNCGACSLSGR